MKKKNSIYPNPDNCLIKENIIYEHYREEFTSIFEKFNDYNKPFSIKSTENGRIESLTNKDDDFFKKYYVIAEKFRTQDDLRKKYFPDIDDAEMGVVEWQFIIFCTSFRGAFASHKIIFLTGSVGEGKSSLVNYVLKYLYHHKESLKERIFPLIINCHGYKPDIEKEYKKTGKIDLFFDKNIKNEINSISNNFTKIDNEEFWGWYEKRFKTSYNSKITDIRLLGYDEKELTKRIREERYEEKKNELDFILNASYFIVEKFKKELVIVFDNIDPFDIDIIKEFYWKAKSIINKSEIKIILCLRKDTYRKLQNKIEEINIVKTIPIKNDLSGIVIRRCENLHKDISITSKSKPLVYNVYGDKNLEIKIDSIQAINRIVSIILNPIGLNCVTTFACKDIRKSLELLRIIFSSGYLPISEIGKYLIADNEYSKLSLPSEYIISTVITFGYGIFFTSEAKKLNIPGAINILSCSNHQNPIQIFNKLYILNYFNQVGFEITVDNKDKIINSFMECTNSMEIKNELTQGFISSFHRLFNKGLIASPDSHYTKTDEEFISDVKEVIISSLGEYYFNNLLVSPFYLMFVKDDVYLKNLEKFKDTYQIYTEENSNRFFWINFKNTVSFLKEYGELEIEALRQFKNHETFDIFQHRFGCTDHKLFTIKIIFELEKYLINKRYLSNELVYFLNQKQVMYSTDINELENIKNYLNNKFEELIND